jgi:cobalt/nickel transport system ATP-binding protein
MGAIAVHNLSYRYPRGAVALDSVSLAVEMGESVGIVGPNGAGKTTLFLCLSGVLAVPPGTISVGGLDPGRAEDRQKLPARVGMIFQNPEDQLFSASVADDVAFGPLNLGLPPEEVRQRVDAALASMGLTGLGERVPLHLSGGEKRRAALAGVLAMRPEILLLDEPSMFLDPRGRREFIGLVNELKITKLIASHDLEMILQTCRRAVVLDGGRLIADGPMREVLADRDVMDKHGLEVPHSLCGWESGN